MSEDDVVVEEGEVVDEPNPVEEKARRMGWVPKDDFRGDDAKWVDAERFVERGENELPIMRERMKKLDKTIVSLNSRIQSMNSTFGEYQTRQQKLEERAYQRAMKDITDRQRKAVESGDTTAFDAAEKEKLDLEPPAAASGPAKPEENTDYQEWVAENDWYLKDKEMQAYAATVSTYVQTRDGLPDGKALYDAVKEEVKLRFPDKFENKNRQRPTPVVGGGDPPPPKGGKTFDDLPKEAKAQCLRFMKDIPGFTKKEYVESHEWE